MESLPHALLRLPDGTTVQAPSGSIIGRLAGTGVRIADPRVSEAHALISLRGQELRLQALRGGLALNGIRVPELVLVAGQRIALAEGLELEVVALSLPEHVMAASVSVDGAEPKSWPLRRAVNAVLPSGVLERGFRTEALAHVWTDAEGWSVQVPGHPPEAFEPGGCWSLGRVELRAVTVELSRLGAQSTVDTGRLHTPLRIEARYDAVHIHRRGRDSLSLSGQSARILSELVLMQGLAPWNAVAGEVWRGEKDPVLLRQAWDQGLRRLRRKLRDAGVRDDLLRSDGRGNIELLLLPGDALDRDL